MRPTLSGRLVASTWPSRAGHVHAVARPLHTGKRTIVVDTELYDDAGRLVARVTQTQAVL